MFLYQRYLEIIAEIEDQLSQQKRREQGLREATELVLVTKYQSPAEISQALGHGLCHFAESRAREAVLKWQQVSAEENLDLARVQIDFIGPVQSNKAQKVASFFSAVHSLAKASTAEALSKALAGTRKQLKVFIQFNASHEKQKNGCSNYAELLQLAEQLDQMPQLSCEGLMCMAQFDSNEQQARDCFANCRELGLKLWREWGKSEPLALSMGMSRDYRWALAEGTSLLRIGSLLFGEAP